MTTDHIVSESRTISTTKSSMQPLKNNKKGSTNAMGKNPLANSIAHVGNPNKNHPHGGVGVAGGNHMDQREKKIFEIYSSGKSSGP